MDKETEKLFRKHRFSSDRIKYILKEPDRCALYLLDDRVVYYYHALKRLLANLPEGDFLRITRGIVLAGSQVREVNGREYTMADGRVFVGNKYDMRKHRQNQAMVAEAEDLRVQLENQHLRAEFAIFDDFPAPFFIIRPRRDQDGYMDYLVCYCNKAMADEERGLPCTVCGRSIFDLFVCCDSSWLETFVKVARHGKSAVIRGFSPGQGKSFTCKCYQVIRGCCGCLLV